MAGILRFIDERASEQWSLVTRQQLLDQKFDRGEIATLLRNRALRIVRPHVYATVGSRRSWQQEALAAVLSVGDGALAARASAARLWKYVHRPEDAVNVLVKSDYTPRL